MTEVANLRFLSDDAPDAEIRIASDEADGAWSYAGTDCRKIPADQPAMNLGFLDSGSPAHQFGNAFGLVRGQKPGAGAFTVRVSRP